jgi:hypothetical protein
LPWFRVFLELQPDRLELVHSSDDVNERGDKAARMVPKKNRGKRPRSTVGSCENSYFRKSNRRCFAADIADDEQNIETRGVEALKLAENDETRHL